MKRAFSIILLTLILVTTTVVFVACSGGVRNEKQWNDAMNYVKTCDTVTISYEQEKTTNGRIYKIHDSKTLTIDVTKGLLYFSSISRTYNILGSMTEQSSQYQYVEVANTQLTNYTKNVVNNSPTNWEETSHSYDSQDEAIQELRKIYESYIKQLGLDDFNYSDFSLKFGKYEKREVVNQKNTLWQLTFSNGKLDKAHFKTSHKKDSSDIDHNKLNITVQYSAEISAPDGLNDAVRK